MIRKGMGLLALLVLAGSATGASAQTMSYAQAGALIANSCGADIEKHCAQVNVGSGQLYACLSAKPGQVSAQCAADYGKVEASIAKRAAAQIDAFTICKNDAREYCKGVVPGDANLLDCLVTASKVVSRACTQVLTDAGWR